MSQPSNQLEQGQALVKRKMDEIVEQRQTTEKISIQARQEFKEQYSESYEEEFEEETFTDELGNTTTTRTESSSEEKNRSRSADVRVKASGLNAEQLQALTQCATEAGQLALENKKPAEEE